MNQIPNIEETNTREIEKIVEKMLAIGWDSKLKKHDGTSIVVSFTKAELCDLLLNIEENHHQQLQKARTESYEQGYTQGKFDEKMDAEYKHPEELQRAREEEKERIETIFKKHVPPHAMDLEDSVWLKRLLNKVFQHD